MFFFVFFLLHPTEYKRSRQEIKRKSLDTIKLQKKARKGEKTLESGPAGAVLELE